MVSFLALESRIVDYWNSVVVRHFVYTLFILASGIESVEQIILLPGGSQKTVIRYALDLDTRHIF